MPTTITALEVLDLLRPVEADSAPVEIVCAGSGQHAIMFLGFLVLQGDRDVLIHNPEGIGVYVSLPESGIEYAEPREAPVEQRKRAERLISFTLKFRVDTWECLLRVWRRPEMQTAN